MESGLGEWLGLGAGNDRGPRLGAGTPGEGSLSLGHGRCHPLSRGRGRTKGPGGRHHQTPGSWESVVLVLGPRPQQPEAQAHVIAGPCPGTPGALGAHLSPPLSP